MNPLRPSDRPCLAKPVAWLLCLMVARLVASQPADLPLEDFVTTDGLVYAIAKTNDVIYFGGSFTSVGRRTGGAVPVSATTGQPEASYPGVNGTVIAAVSDGSGGWFLGGTFTRVGGLPRTNLVHLLGDRSVESNWRPGVFGGYVGSLVLDGNRLYLGGFFTNVNGQTRNRLAALDASTGTLEDWNPDANAEVRALAIEGNTVYIGGDFRTVAGQSRDRIAA